MKEQSINSKKKIDEHKSAIAILNLLVGKSPAQMSTKEKEDLLIAIGMIIGILDDKGNVKPT